jgi:L-fucose isomerase, C-terminal domain
MSTLKPLTIYRAASPIHSPEAVALAHSELLKALADVFDLTILPIDRLPTSAGHAVIFMATGGVEQMVSERLAQNPPRRVTLLADGLQNSLAASLETAAWLNTRSVPVRIIHDSPSRMASQLAAELADRFAVIAGSRIGLIGPASSWLIASDIDRQEVSRRYGLEFIDISLAEVEEAFARAVPVDVPGIDAMPRVEPDDADISRALRLYAALNEIVERYRLDAFTIRCFDLLTSLRTTGCLSLALFNARGIAAGCEGDIPALLTMLWAYRRTGRMGFMANPSRIDTASNTITLAHCTLPLNMAKRNILRSHFESGIGVALQGIIAPGPVTLLKWWGHDMDRLFTAHGVLVENTDNPSMCRTQVTLHLDSPIDSLLTTSFANHHIVVQGHI